MLKTWSHPFTAIAVRTTPVMAPPAISPLEKSTPGPESELASSSPVTPFFRSTYQRRTPPMNIVALVEIGRYAPTATGSDAMPSISITMASEAPIRTSPHGSFRVRMPSTTSDMICAFGESSLSTSLPSAPTRSRPPMPGSIRNLIAPASSTM